ncbi:response regulator [Pelotomaculum propionicicum]|uniref:response regulator n=1 Tax=Pelotomaculum propionicicum TaxID=258475 RepID=UPI003B80DECC
MNKRILIVDDSSFARSMLTEIFIKHGYDVVGEASSGSEALEKYGQLKPDLVTMDIAMPGLDGIMAIKEIIHSFPEARVVVISSIHSKEIVKKALLAGAFDYVIKPFTKERLLKAIDKALLQG